MKASDSNSVNINCYLYIGKSGVRFVGAGDLPAHLRVQTGSEIHPTSIQWAKVALSPEVRVQLSGR